MDTNTIITGANRGIGLAMVKKFAKNGCNVWACARKQNAEFEAEMGALAEQNHVWIKPVYFDLSHEENIKNGFMCIYNDKKPIHTLINNAGIVYNEIFQMTPIGKIMELFNINVFSVMSLTQLVLKVFTKQKYGNIINITSTAGITPYASNSCYGSTKAAVISFTKSLAIEVAAFGNIRVNAVAPGPTDTDMLTGLPGKYANTILNNCAMDRLAQPLEIANVAYFLSSNEASFVNGQVIRVDGGECYGK